MKFKAFVVFFNLLFFCTLLRAQPPAPGKAQGLPIIITGGTIHVGNGQVIENGELRIARGKIVYVGAIQSNINTSEFEIINAQGKHIYPGLILAGTTLGLAEVEAVRATLDFNEVGEFNPNVRSLIAYNTDSELIPTTRSNGILLAQVAPEGSVVAGTSSVVQLDAWNWEDAAYRADDGIHITWPQQFTSNWWEEAGEVKRNEKYKDQVAKLKKVFDDAWAYNQISAPVPSNIKLEAMHGLFDGTKKLYIQANFAKDIVEAVKFAKSQQVKHVVIVGGNDAWMITDFLKENNVMVLLRETFRLPARADEDIHQPNKLPYLLQKAGVTYGLSLAASVQTARNLPFTAGSAAAHGLTREEALRAVSLNVAKILGIDDRTGSLEVGKDANVVISEGDLLDMRTNEVTHAFIQGRKLNLDNKHKRLYEKFKTKYDGK